MGSVKRARNIAVGFLVGSIALAGCQQKVFPEDHWISGTIFAPDHKIVTILLADEEQPLRLRRDKRLMEECLQNAGNTYATLLASGDVIIDPGDGITGEFQGIINRTEGTFQLVCARNLDGYQITE